MVSPWYDPFRCFDIELILQSASQQESTFPNHVFDVHTPDTTSNTITPHTLSLVPPGGIDQLPTMHYDEGTLVFGVERSVSPRKV